MRTRNLIVGLVTAAAVLALFFTGVVWISAKAVSHALPSPHSTCSALNSNNCTGVTPEFVELVTGVQLPLGTRVVKGGTNAWVEWTLEVTVAIPKGTAPPEPSAPEATTLVKYVGTNKQGEQIVLISTTRRAGQPWPEP